MHSITRLTGAALRRATFLVVCLCLSGAVVAAPAPAAGGLPPPYLPLGKIMALPPGSWDFGAQAGGPVERTAPTAPGQPATLPVFGTDVTVSAGGANEVVIVANPLDPLNFVAGANAGGGSGHYATTDGGQTWVRGVFGGIGDPTATFDGSGNAYFGQLTTFSCPDPVNVYKSTNGGVSWGSGVQALSDPSPSDHFIDKEWLAADTWPGSPYYGRIYVAAMSFYAPGCNLGAYINNRGVTAHSSNGGATWSGSITFTDAAHDQDQFANPVVAPNGTVHMGFQYQNCTYNCTSTIPMSNLTTHSTDGGVSWSTPITITGGPISPTGAFVNGYQYLYASSTSSGFRHNDQAILGVSPVDPNELYALWTDGRWESTFVYQSVTGWHADIAFSRSTDGGVTWSPILRVNDDAQGNGKDQFFPWLVVGRDGTLHASWMDRRDSTSGFLYGEYYTQSTDGGLTWSANQPVADLLMTPVGFMGDYTGIAVNRDNTLVLPIWTDTRAGTQAYTDRGVLSQAPPPVLLPAVLYNSPIP